MEICFYYISLRFLEIIGVGFVVKRIFYFIYMGSNWWVIGNDNLFFKSGIVGFEGIR